MGRASSPTANRWAATASSPVCYTTWLGLGWLLPHRYVILYLVRVRVAASSPVHAHACSHVSCSRGPYAHARRRMCTCHVRRMRVSHMRAWCWPAPRSHARPHAACSSRLGPQQALASPGLGFERRLSAAVLDRACPDWKRPHSQATARCLAGCMARWSQGARWSSGGPMGVSARGHSEGARKARGGRRYPPEWRWHMAHARPPDVRT